MSGVELAAVGLAGMFSGGAVYVAWAEHPARLRVPVREAVAQFGPSYRRAAVLQASLAVATLAAGLTAWGEDDSGAWLLGSACMAGVLAFTMATLLKPSYQLIRGEGSDEQLRRTLRWWGHLHLVRTALGLGALISFLVAAP